MNLQEVWLELQNLVQVCQGGPGAGEGHVDSGPLVVGHIVVGVRVHRSVEVGEGIGIRSPDANKLKKLPSIKIMP